MPQDASGLLDYIAVIKKHRRMICRLWGAAIITAAVTVACLPEIYSATAVIMPPTNEETMARLTAKMGGVAGLTGGIVGLSNMVKLYMDMLRSRTVADAIVNRFDLKQVYGERLLKNTRNKLRDNTDIEISPADTISITVEDRDPHRAAEITNAYVEELDKLNQNLGISDAARQRIFLEKRLTDIKRELAQAEVRLREFQERNKVVALEEQAKVSIQGAALIKGQIIAAETELEVTKKFVTGKNNKIVRLEQQIAELKAQLAKIETGERNGHPAPGSNFYLSFPQMPDLGIQLARLMREVKIQETVFELVTQQYELARIAEAKDTPTVRVLDRAVVPEDKAKPSRGILVVLAGIAGLAAAIIAAFMIEYMHGLRNCMVKDEVCGNN